MSFSIAQRPNAIHSLSTTLVVLIVSLPAPWTAAAPPPAEASPPSTTPSSPPQLQPLIQPRESKDSVRAEIRTADLEARNAELERRLAEAEREAARYRRGLENAVRELNRVTPKRLEMPPPITSEVSPVDVYTRHSAVLSRPRVRVDGYRATVYGELRNGHLEPVAGILKIELLRDGAPFDETRLRFEVPAASAGPYAHRFALEGYAAGIYTARVELEIDSPPKRR